MNKGMKRYGGRIWVRYCDDWYSTGADGRRGVWVGPRWDDVVRYHAVMTAA